MKSLRALFRNSDATAAVEAAIFAPIFLLFTFGITDLGSAMFVRMAVNAATQAGATYAVFQSESTCSASGTPTLTAACSSGIEQAMNDATADSSFCTGTVCSASIGPCPDVSSNTCITISATFPYTPIMSRTIYSWAMDQNALSTTSVRIQ
jgi:Flp pilus assembly protein TadG